jgi:CubicO group peptidase (beta-lactamase class C family)
MSYSGVGYGLLAEITRRISGRHLGDFARERIFEPLGMMDTWYVVPEEEQARIVKHPRESPDAEWLDDPQRYELPSAGAGGFGTAMDMAVFCQTFLNGGSYGDVRLLSPASAREMTRNQIPGLSSSFMEEYFPEATWGYGWGVKGTKKAREWGSLDSPESYSHQGAGGVYVWVDPAYDLVGVFFSTIFGIMTPNLYRPHWCLDLFVNMVTAAIDD